MLQTKELTYIHEGAPLIENISLEFPQGWLYGILGPNGSGKSTLLKSLMGIWRPSRGKVLWQGSELLQKNRLEISRTIALVPQNPQVHFDFTVEEMTAMGRYPHGGYRDCKDGNLLDLALETADIMHLRKRRLNCLSNGERQRVYIARALVTESPVMLLDEPTASLDIRHQLEIWHLLKKLQEAGKVIIITTHDLLFTERFCDRVAVLNQGRCIANGTFTEVLGSALFTQVFGVQENKISGTRRYELA